jgi:uncharacterized membrane protein YhaH (DUF805 family)
MAGPGEPEPGVATPGRGCLFAALTAISTFISLALISSGGCEMTTGKRVGLLVFLPLVVIFSSTAVAIRTWRASDRLWWKVVKLVGSVAIGLVASAAILIAVLLSQSECLD